ncbi:MAG: SIR2 family protein, partial [Candidatus Marinimicrobia bacterium]|nr:SIR2 family protein [Candidatus Neomarinimicrobiota bacterium]
MADNLVPLITNLASRNRDYVIFVGAGLSKDAGVRSGWDILIETLKPLYLEENKLEELPEDHYQLIQEWYLNHKEIEQLGYSEILELMYKGNIERRDYLKKFFVDVRPGEAHRQLALMVKNELIRFIFTTNFDDLIEKALEEIDIHNYDVIFSEDQLQETSSWDKVRVCRIYKLHGDYKTGKVRNTIEELKSLSPLISEDFQYIIDRHGLIVIGYAGRDEGIMQHFLKREPYAYPFYWQNRKHPEDEKEFKFYYDMLNKYKNEHKREIIFIKNDSASKFLSELNEGVGKLERVLVASEGGQEKFEEYVVNSDERKIRAMTIELSNRFKQLYDQCTEKEDLDRHFSYKFEVFSEFIGEIGFVFEYVDVLLN